MVMCFAHIINRRVKNSMFQIVVLYLVMLLVTITDILIRIANSELLTYYCLTLIKKEYSLGYRIKYYSYTSKNVRRAKRRIGYLNSLIVSLSKRINPIKVTKSANRSKYLFVASSVDRIGGHTRLISYYYKGINDAKLFISGDIRDRNVKQKQEQFISMVENIIGEPNVYLADLSIENTKGIIIDFITKIAAINPRNIITFHAGSDILLLISLLVYRNMDPKIKIFFYHHGDDYLQLLDEHFDLHIDIDHSTDVKCKHIKKRKLIRLATESRFDCNSIKSEIFTIFSFAPPRKIFSAAHDSLFLETIAYLSLLNSCKIILASTSDNSQTHTALVNMDCNMERIKIVSDCYDIKDYPEPIDIYLDTFPVGGGLAVIESLSLGVPTIINAMPGYQVFRDPVLSHFMFYSVNDIKDYINTLITDKAFRKEEGNVAYTIFTSNYQIDTAVSSLLSVIN